MNNKIGTVTLSTSPSVQLLALTQRMRSVASGSAFGANSLIVGNPKMPVFAPSPKEKPIPLVSLPGSESEAKAIASLLNTKAIIGEDATKAEVLRSLPSSQLIHLATHSLLDINPDLTEFGVPVNANLPSARKSHVNVTGGSVIFGGNVTINGVPAAIALANEHVVRTEIPGMIALTPSGGDNGFLSAKEILGLRLKANLVVVSACSTGRGRVTGDGVLGLSRAFIAAGVPSVVVSLWAIPDDPTAFLMAEFYQNMKQNPDKAKALRQAMLKAMAKYPNPKDWAAFTLVGETQ